MNAKSISFLRKDTRRLDDNLVSNLKHGTFAPNLLDSYDETIRLSQFNHPLMESDVGFYVKTGSAYL